MSQGGVSCEERKSRLSSKILVLTVRRLRQEQVTQQTTRTAAR